MRKWKRVNITNITPQATEEKIKIVWTLETSLRKASQQLCNVIQAVVGWFAALNAEQPKLNNLIYTQLSICKRKCYNALHIKPWYVVLCVLHVCQKENWAMSSVKRLANLGVIHYLWYSNNGSCCIFSKIFRTNGGWIVNYLWPSPSTSLVVYMSDSPSPSTSSSHTNR
jgi:hypothetical protein